MTQIIEQESERPALVVRQEFGDVNPAQLLQIALQQGAGLDMLERILAVKLQWEANEARKAFVVGLSAFKADPPEVFKNKHVAIPHKDGRGFTEYDHATLDHISAEIGKSLAKQGMSHRWDVEQLDGGIINVTCILQHALGHSEKVTMRSLPDQSGSKNSIQAVGSTVTYLQRYTLLAATGIAVKGQDDDGRKSDQPGTPSNVINEEQLETLRSAMRVAGVDDSYICAKGRIDSVELLQPSRFHAVMNHLKKLSIGG